MLLVVPVVPDDVDDIVVLPVDVCEPDVLELPVVLVLEVPVVVPVVVSVELPSVVAGVPWMVRDPMPETLESKLFWVPFSVTVTMPGLPARMVMESVTV